MHLAALRRSVLNMILLWYQNFPSLQENSCGNGSLENPNVARWGGHLRVFRPQKTALNAWNSISPFINIQWHWMNRSVRSASSSLTVCGPSASVLCFHRDSGWVSLKPSYFTFLHVVKRAAAVGTWAHKYARAAILKNAWRSRQGARVSIASWEIHLYPNIVRV